MKKILSIIFIITIILSCDDDTTVSTVESQVMELSVLLNDLEYPKALFLSNDILYFTETAGRNTSFGGKIALNAYDPATDTKVVLKENPENSDALVVINDDIYLSSYYNGIPGEYGKVSTFNLFSQTESHFMDVEIATSDMTLDNENNIYLLGSSRKSDAKSLYKFSAPNYTNPTVVLKGLDITWSIAFGNGEIYYSDLQKINIYNDASGSLLFSEKTGILGMAVSEKYLYYASYLDGYVGRIDLNTKTDLTLYNDLDRPATMAFDKQNNALYVLTNGTQENEFKDSQLIKISNIE